MYPNSMFSVTLLIHIPHKSIPATVSFVDDSIPDKDTSLIYTIL